MDISNTVQEVKQFVKNVYWNATDLFKPVLSDRTIIRYNKKGLLIEGELSPNQIQPNSISGKV